MQLKAIKVKVNRFLINVLYLAVRIHSGEIKLIFTW